MSVSNATTTEGEVLRLTKEVAALYVLRAGWGALYDSRLTALIKELKRENAEWKTPVVKSDGLVVRLQELNVGLSTRVENFNTVLDTIVSTDVDILNGELRKVCNELVSVRVEVLWCA